MTLLIAVTWYNKIT